MYTVGDKFIIEIESHTATPTSDLYGIKGFMGLVLNECWLERLERYKPLETEQLEAAWQSGYEANKNTRDGLYQAGLLDAWEAAGMIFGENKLKTEELAEIFGVVYGDCEGIFDEMPVSEVVEAIKYYKEKQAEAQAKEQEKGLRIGDEVYTSKDINGKYLDVGIVIRVGYCANPTGVTVMSRDGGIYGNHEGTCWHKTGRHFPEFAKMLEQIGRQDEEL